jgi:hypothetical protein
MAARVDMFRLKSVATLVVAPLILIVRSIRSARTDEPMRIDESAAPSPISDPFRLWSEAA